MLTQPTVKRFILIGTVLAASYAHNARADCPPSPTTYSNGVIEGPVETNGSRNATVAVAATGQFITAYESSNFISGRNTLFVARFNADGGCLCEGGDFCPAQVTTTQSAKYRHPSLAIQKVGDPVFRLVWQGERSPATISNRGGKLYALDYRLLESPFQPPRGTIPPVSDLIYTVPSTGISDGGVCADSWLLGVVPVAVETVSTDLGLVNDADCSAISFNYILTCTGASPSFCYGWQPTVSMRRDEFTTAWNHAETDEEEPFFDIVIREYSSAAAPIGSTVTVNQPISTEDTTEASVATAIQGDDIVAVWVGSWPDNCPQRLRVYARRLRWNATTEPSFVGDQFIVDSDPNFTLPNLVEANPTVAISPGGNEFVVAWVVTGSNSREVHAQFFRFDGDCVRPLGREFRVNQDTSATADLGDSAQHTCQYAPNGSVVFVWTRGTTLTTPIVHFTILPPGFADVQEAAAPCLKGDCNGDGLINGLDIQPFVERLLGVPNPVTFDCHSIVDNCPFDMNNDGVVSAADIPPFICLLLALPGNCAGGPACFATLETDCNSNGVEDVVDLYQRSSGDCNTNGIPDECDIAAETSADANTNGIPDECEVPKHDCNTNGIEDETDIAEQTSADCNTNGFPDECEPDCNSNGYPDDCDVAEERSPDCNNNGYPDECDFDLPFLPSFDCNTNGVPDECDIASEYSSDENANNIPDECEEGGQQMMGGTINSQNVNNQNDGSQDAGIFSDPAWEEFFNWQFEQQSALRAMTRPERFETTRAKLRALGLPDAIPWAQVRPGP
jgi:hypothetical protein